MQKINIGAAALLAFGFLDGNATKLREAEADHPKPEILDFAQYGGWRYGYNHYFNRP